jgi:hypothetical protein
MKEYTELLRIATNGSFVNETGLKKIAYIKEGDAGCSGPDEGKPEKAIKCTLQPPLPLL